MSDTTDAVITGEQCADCLIFFRKAHGYPVLCHSCFANAPKDTPYQRATEKEL